MSKRLREKFEDIFEQYTNGPLSLEGMKDCCIRVAEQHYASAQPAGMTVKSLYEKFEGARFDDIDAHAPSMFIPEILAMIDDHLNEILTGETARKAQPTFEPFEDTGLSMPSNPPASAEVEFDRSAVIAHWNALSGCHPDSMQTTFALELVEWAITTFKAPRREMLTNSQLQKLWRETEDYPEAEAEAIRFAYAVLRAFPVPAEQPPKVETRSVVDLDRIERALLDLFSWVADNRPTPSSLATIMQEMAEAFAELQERYRSAPSPAPVYDEAAERVKANTLVDEYANAGGLVSTSYRVGFVDGYLARAKLGTVQADPERERLRDAVIEATYEAKGARE